MDLYTLTGSEAAPAYQALASANGKRHSDYLHSMISASIQMARPLLSHELIKAVNFHAIAGLHHEAGRYRVHDISVGGGRFLPPPPHRVMPLMDEMVNRLMWQWKDGDPFALATDALWKINHIHPFVNGNGRTARGICYFILCVKVGRILPGQHTLSELLGKSYRPQYVAALKSADKGDLQPLTRLVRTLVTIQIFGPQ